MQEKQEKEDTVIADSNAQPSAGRSIGAWTSPLHCRGHAPCKPLMCKQVLLHQRVCFYISNLKALIRHHAPCSGLQSPDAAVLRSRTLISRAWLVLLGR